MPSDNSIKNLKKGKETKFRSGEEAANKGKIGGIKSGEARRRKKAYSEIAKNLGECKITEGSVLRQFQAFGVIDEDGLPLDTAIVAGQIIAGIKGNTAAAQWIKDLSEKDKIKELQAKKLKLENERLKQEIELLKVQTEAAKMRNESKNSESSESRLSNFMSTVMEEIGEDPNGY